MSLSGKATPYCVLVARDVKGSESSVSFWDVGDACNMQVVQRPLWFVSALLISDFGQPVVLPGFLLLLKFI